MGQSFDISPEDLRVFLDEAEELLQQMEEDILALEQDPDNAGPLQSVFRAAHTLKGSSATLGHRQMAEITHAMENLLDKLRKGNLRAGRPVVDALFACLDVLKTLKEEIATGEPAGIETHAVLARLAQAEEQAAAARMAAPAAPSAAVGTGPADRPAPDAAPLPAELPPLGPAERRRLAAGRERGLKPWELALSSLPNAPMPAVRFYQVLLALEEAGEVVASWPPREAIEQDQVGTDLRVVFLTDRPEPALREALAAVAEVAVRVLRPLSLPDGDAGRAGPPHPGGEEAAAGRRSARTVRVDVEVLDNLMNYVGELVIDRTRLSQVITQAEAARLGDDLLRDLQTIVAHIGRITGQLQEEIMRARMLPVASLFRKFPRMVRDVALKAQKEVRLVVRGEETELDRSVIEEIGDPLMHLLRNAVDHGIEPPMERLTAGKESCGTIWLEARHEDNQIVITVRDDGRGIAIDRVRAAAVRKGLLSADQVRRLDDDEALRLIFLPGFSTAERVSDISGRGVGLDVVHRNLERLGGAIDVRTEVGRGTEFRIRLPLTLAIIRALLVEHRQVVYAVPLTAITETVRWPASAVQTVRRQPVILSRGQVVPLVRLEEAFQLPAGEPAATGDLFIVIVNVFGRQAGLVVDRLVGEGDVVIKSLGRYVGEVPGISGATILGDGSVALILDVASLLQGA